MKILSVADIHINLHKKKVPYDWQYNRFAMLFNRLLELEKEVDVVVIAGDIFDKKPETDEICLFLSYANQVTKPTLALDGNHEASSKGKTFLEHFTRDNAINNPKFMLYTENSRVTIQGQAFQMFPYNEMKKNNIPTYVDGDILVTHIRGEVPPHITAEFDFEKIRPWPLTLLGDLHHRHKYKDFNVYYPGSPLNTSFDRSEDRNYGVDLITLNTSSDYRVEFIDLKLPKLIRRTVKAGESLTPHDYHHVVYEITGSIDVLSKVANHELLDKKIAEKPSNKVTISLEGKTKQQKIRAYLEYEKVQNIEGVMRTYEGLNL